MFSGGFKGSGNSAGGKSLGSGTAPQPAGGSDPLAEAEAALKRLRQKPDDKQAADALEKALQRLKERTKPDGAKKE